MKKILLILILLVVPLIVFFQFNTQVLAQSNKVQIFVNDLLTFSVCDEPILYRIDTIDPRFKITKEELLSDLDDASSIWNRLGDKRLFVYDPKGQLSINLLYDQRQYLTTKINQMEQQVKSGKESLKPQIEQFQKQAAQLSQKIVSLNKEVEDWNSKGGAPSEEFDKIIQRQQELKAERDRLNAVAKNLNISADEYNSQVDALNQNISTFNNALEERPEEGVYKRAEDKIEIYFSSSKAEFIHTLAHELGHAIGLGHSNNRQAIMYSKTSEVITPAKEDIYELENICRKRSVFEPFQTRVRQLLDSYLQR